MWRGACGVLTCRCVQLFCERKYLIMRSKREAVEREMGITRFEMNDGVPYGDESALSLSALYATSGDGGVDTDSVTLDAGPGADEVCGSRSHPPPVSGAAVAGLFLPRPVRPLCSPLQLLLLRLSRLLLHWVAAAHAVGVRCRPSAGGWARMPSRQVPMQASCTLWRHGLRCCVALLHGVAWRGVAGWGGGPPG
jgi:hypothetical protein